MRNIDIVNERNLAEVFVGLELIKNASPVINPSTELGVKRKTGARNPRYGEWNGLCTMRDLRLNPVSLPT